LRQLGLRKPILTVPVFVCRAAAFVLEKAMDDPPLTRYGISRILHEAAFDNSPARRDLGYDPVGVREGLRRVYPI
jgi:nucleoside-diphosphate-sugar epimerase